MKRNLVVVGASAGGVEALRTLMSGMPADFDAAVLVVLHLPAGSRTALPYILDRAGPLRVRQAAEGDRLQAGQVLVAPPDQHLLVVDGKVTLSSGPRENGHRPAVDALFRSAARSHGRRVVAVVLSGAMDDGTAGMVAVHSRGGVGVVQDPSDALHPSMPRCAIQGASPEHVVAVQKIPGLLAALLREDLPDGDVAPVPPLLEAETDIVTNAGLSANGNAGLGEPSGFSCPDCNGSLFVLEDGPLRRFRCRVGHAWSPEGLLVQQSSALESALWTALRSLEEKAALTLDLTGRAAERGHALSASAFERQRQDPSTPPCWCGTCSNGSPPGWWTCRVSTRRATPRTGAAAVARCPVSARSDPARNVRRRRRRRAVPVSTVVTTTCARLPGRKGTLVSEVDGSFESLLEHIRESRGFDFTGYKRESLTRRVRRRMQDIGVTSFEGYSDHLQVHPEEFKHLFDTVLINLTGFFRDPEAWQYLQEQIIPEIVEQRPNGPIRIWSAGCAGGQEAYTLAICFAEALGVDDLRQRVKIYATDVDDHALAQARAATYSRAQVAGLSEERLARWFEPVSAGNAFVVGKLLRRSVIFGRNDLVQDAPISRIDLLLNRNTLMYFNAETQGHVLQRLHFALNPGGFLFLGKAEMLLRHPDLFVPVEARRRLFRKVAHEPVAERQTFHGRRPAGRDAAPDALRQHVRHEAMMAAPTAQIAVDADGLLALCNRRAEALFGLGGRILGQPFQDLQLSYRPVELRAPMEQAHQDRRAVWLRGVEWLRSPTEVMVLDVQVLPLFGGDGARLGTTVMFHDVTRHHQLQAELQFANRQLEEAYQELQSSNEELETTNEELQSTNEELETINEELHSMNDELQTTNEDLRSASERLDELNHFLEAVLGSLESAVVVVDDELTVIAWNTAAAELWGVRTDEAVGRPLPQLDIGLPLDDVVPLLSTAVAAPDPGHSGLLAAGVNRRGRPVCVQVTVSPLRRPDQTPSGAILVMDVVPDSTG